MPDSGWRERTLERRAASHRWRLAALALRACQCATAGSLPEPGKCGQAVRPVACARQNRLDQRLSVSHCVSGIDRAVPSQTLPPVWNLQEGLRWRSRPGYGS